MGIFSRIFGIKGKPDLENIGDASHRRVYRIVDGSEARKLIMSESGEKAKIRLKGRVLKVAKDEEGAVRNMREYKTFMELRDSELGRDLNPAFYCTKDGEFLVSRFVDTDVSVGKEVSDFFSRVKRDALEMGIDPKRVDVGVHNVGFDKKRKKYVIYDYPWMDK
ncbi:MAG: hypothetical protein ACLFRK_01870 [Candidatus Nanohaloarchaea archaeon]